MGWSVIQGFARCARCTPGYHLLPLRGEGNGAVWPPGEPRPPGAGVRSVAPPGLVGWFGLASRGCAALHPWLPSVAAPRLQGGRHVFATGWWVSAAGRSRGPFLFLQRTVPAARANPGAPAPAGAAACSQGWSEPKASATPGTRAQPTTRAPEGRRNTTIGRRSTAAGLTG